MKMMSPQNHASSRLVLGLCSFFLAHSPKAWALPVRLSIPTSPPSSAQKRKILMFQPSERTSAMRSVRFRMATNGLPPATMSAPTIIPKNSDTMTSLVMNASVMVKIGGMSPQIPKCAIFDPFSGTLYTITTCITSTNYNNL